MSCAQAARELGVSERTLRRYISSGQIRFHRLPGGHYRIPLEAIAEFWAEHDDGAGPREEDRADARRARAGGRSYKARAVGASRRPALGREAPRDFDLSPRRLAQLRAEHTETRSA